jgi:type IV secretory pathway VirB2 component (pilin)
MKIHTRSRHVVIAMPVRQNPLRSMRTWVPPRIAAQLAATVAIISRNSCRIAAISVAVLSSLLSLPANAAGSDMPWEAPLQDILDSIQGPVARIFAVIAIAVTGLTLAFGDSSGGFRKLIQIVFGISIAFAATSFFLGFFGYAGGAVVG